VPSSDAGFDDAAQDAGKRAMRPAVVVPAELSDPGGLNAFLRWDDLPVFGDGQHVRNSSSDRGTGNVPLPILENDNRDTNNFVCPGRNVRGNELAAVEATFDLETCPEDYVEGHVLARMEGAGRLFRFWAGWFTAPANEVVLIYVDDDPEPRARIPLKDIVEGRAGEMFNRPFNAGFMNHLAWYYPVAFTSKLVVSIDGVSFLGAYYYQVDAVMTDEVELVGAESPRLAARDDAIAVLNTTADITPGSGMRSSAEGTVAPGEVIALSLLGPATIHRVEARIPTKTLANYADADIAVTWDGEDGPALELPLLELFAASHDPPGDASSALGSRVEDDMTVLVLRLPMPFATSAEWTVRNNSTQPLPVILDVETSEGIPADDWGHLRVSRQESVPSNERARHPILNALGRGRMAGLCMMLEGQAVERVGSVSTRGLNFLEGDERIVLDGGRTLLGTGTEDIINGSFYFDEGPFATPFAQAWAIEENEAVTPETGQVSACRWYAWHDAIDFAESIEYDLEIGPGEPSSLRRYRTVAYFYQ
jgi:hypothetical protein